jgi:hypothetical protein
MKLLRVVAGEDYWRGRPDDVPMMSLGSAFMAVE